VTARRTRYATAAAMALLAVPTAGCIGPFADFLEPPPPTSVAVCCDGYGQRRLGRLVGAKATPVAHDEIELESGQYRLRVEAVAVGRDVDPDATRDREVEALVAADAGHEVFAALLVLTSVRPKLDKYGVYATGVSLRALDEPAESFYAGLIHQEGRPRGAKALVLLAVVPKGGRLVLCADTGDPDPPCLDARTGQTAT